MPSSTDTDDDFADFTVVSIDRHHYDPVDDKIVTPPTQNLHRKSSAIMATTGRKIHRSYSTWTALAHNTTTNNNNTDPQLQSRPSQINQSQKTTSNSYLSQILRWNNLKSAIAYFLASLVIYIPSIASLLGKTDSKHLTCTVVVYFHPSRTIGSMIQAILFVIISLSFSITITFATYTIQYYLQFDSPIFILLVASSALGVISYFKHRVGRQTFNTSCSLAAIVIISCLIKIYSTIFDSDSPNIQFPIEKIRSVILCVSFGCMISVFICFLLWRTWAQNNLTSQLIEIKSLIANTLAQLTDAFTQSTDPKDIPQSRDLIVAQFKSIKSKLGALDSSLEETKFECYLLGNEKQYHYLSLLVESTKKLVNYLGGLNRALEFKWELIEYYDKLRKEKSAASTPPPPTPFESQESLSSPSPLSSPQSVEIDDVVVEKPEELIDLFIYHLGPSIKSFVYTMNDILSDQMLQMDRVDPIVIQYNKSLQLAKSLFEKHQRSAIDSLYKQEIFVTSWNKDVKINQEEVAATCANFAFSVTQISNEVENMLSIMSTLYQYLQTPTRSFEFLKLWKLSTPSHIMENKTASLFADIAKQAYQLSDNTNTNRSLGYKIWKLSKFTRSNDFQFGFRVGIGALILGSLAFSDYTRHVFIEYRGEWGLVTYAIIMNKSLGGTAMTVKWRFLGTFIGALLAYTVWTCFYPNVILMSLFGLIVSVPCFDIILNWKANNPFGRFILLTYNLTVLYSYTMSLQDGSPSDGDDWEGGSGKPIIREIAFHRYAAVSFGVFWALLVTTTLLPVTARDRLKKGLAVVWLRMGLIWKKGPLCIEKNAYQQDRLQGLHGLPECHAIVGELRVLLKQAPMEMRMKGPFPLESYSKLISGTESILDSYENINSLIDMDPLLNPVESIVLQNLREEMKELQDRVFLIFYMLASAVKLGLPLASDPATTENAMMKMLIKLADVRRTVEARKELGKNAGLKNDDFVLFYTYCLVTNSIVHQLDNLMEEVITLFGKIDEETLDLN